MATATDYLNDLRSAGVPTHRPAIHHLAARKAFEDAHLGPENMVMFLREQIAALGGHSKAALFDCVAADLRKHFEDDTADHLNFAADAIRAELRGEDIALHGAEVGR